MPLKKDITLYQPAVPQLAKVDGYDGCFYKQYGDSHYRYSNNYQHSNKYQEDVLVCLAPDELAQFNVGKLGESGQAKIQKAQELFQSDLAIFNTAQLKYQEAIDFAEKYPDVGHFGKISIIDLSDGYYYYPAREGIPRHVDITKAPMVAAQLQRLNNRQQSKVVRWGGRVVLIVSVFQCSLKRDVGASQGCEVFFITRHE